jgi:hypothetical protein
MTTPTTTPAVDYRAVLADFLVGNRTAGGPYRVTAEDGPRWQTSAAYTQRYTLETLDADGAATVLLDVRLTSAGIAALLRDALAR